MNKLLNSQTVSTGLAIFAMFFGAGNLIYPLMVGMTSGNLTGIGFLGFSLTAVLLPLAGLIAMILFEGDYEVFFNRLGKIPGALLIATSMVIIGPLIAIPRIVTLSHTMVAPFMPFKTLQAINPLSSFIFAILFLGVTFLMTYRENKIVNLLGSVVSPLLLISLVIIIIKGFISGATPIAPTYTSLQIVINNIIRGYETLDLLGGIFFASIVFKILKQTTESNVKRLAYLGLKSGLLGIGLLALVYAGMSYLSAFNGLGLEGLDAGERFQRNFIPRLGQRRSGNHWYRSSYGMSINIYCSRCSRRGIRTTYHRKRSYFLCNCSIARSRSFYAALYLWAARSVNAHYRSNYLCWISNTHCSHHCQYFV